MLIPSLRVRCPATMAFMRLRTHTALIGILLVASLAGCVPLAPRAADAPVVTRAVVTRNTDGDTAHFRLEGGAEEKVRFIGINTPEVGERLEPLGNEASAYTAQAIPPGTTVWLETDAELRDRYGRLLAYVWLEQPVSGDEAEVRAKMLNARIVADGYGQVYTFPPNVKYVDVYRACEADASVAQ